jgi:endoplasmic reticulum Man9GlcNAc2 1,2-alpha-mannosidase
MYKDKPYGYGAQGSRRGRRSRLLWGLLIFFGIAGWLWWTQGAAQGRTGVFRGSGGMEVKHSQNRKGEGLWWKRREEVVTAMEKSWAAYEKYAWGRFDEHAWQWNADELNRI